MTSSKKRIRIIHSFIDGLAKMLDFNHVLKPHSLKKREISGFEADYNNISKDFQKSFERLRSKCPEIK